MKAARLTMALFACAVLAACGTGPSNTATTATGSTRQPIAFAVAGEPRVSAPAMPAQLPVGFSNLPPGTYAVHLHSICNGMQNYHLAYLPDLSVGPAHTGQVIVPTADFGRGWCVIVYKDASRNIVLITHAI